MIGVDDKRGFYRMAIESPVLIQLSGQGDVLSARCLDLSATGMSVVVENPLEKEQRLSVELAANGEQIAPLKAEAQVISCEPHDEGYRLGLALQQIH